MGITGNRNREAMSVGERVLEETCRILLCRGKY